nr:serine protease [Neobacillus sp. Marseille-Q6967]
MDIPKIEEEMSQLQNRLVFLEKQLKEIQKNCEHHFKMHPNYEKCIKCNKVNVLHY